MCAVLLLTAIIKSLPAFERAGVGKYLRSKRREEEKEKLDKQANSVLQTKLDNMLHGSEIVSQ